MTVEPIALNSCAGETAEPMVSLRFVGGRLQQAWLIRGAAPYVEWRDVPQHQTAQTSPPAWRSLTANDLELSVRARNVMNRMHWDPYSQTGSPATLGDVADMTDAEILRTPECGRKTLKELRDMVEKMRAQPIP
jgi:DNA-directed RNA polymerase alpha subunit